MASRTTCSGEAGAVAMGSQMPDWPEAIGTGWLVRQGEGLGQEIVETILPVDFHHAPEQVLPADRGVRFRRGPGSLIFSESGAKDGRELFSKRRTSKS